MRDIDSSDSTLALRPFRRDGDPIVYDFTLLSRSEIESLRADMREAAEWALNELRKNPL